MAEIPKNVVEAHAHALASLNHSYAPYSSIHVCAGLKLAKKQQLVWGVNVENASYGATICAERSAIVSAISQFGSELNFEFLLIISNISGEPIAPCGMCLQVIQEFAAPELPIYLGDQKTVKLARQLKDFLPHSFGKNRVLQP